MKQYTTMMPISNCSHVFCFIDNYECQANEWACPDTGKCIPLSKVCDKSQDCDNGSDEGESCSEYPNCKKELNLLS